MVIRNLHWLTKPVSQVVGNVPKSSGYYQVTNNKGPPWDFSKETPVIDKAVEEKPPKRIPELGERVLEL